MTRALALVLVAGGVLLCSAACSNTSDPGVIRERARISRTEFAVAHVSAKDLRSVAFGQGFAYAQDHVCVLADQIIKVRSERAAFFGPGEAEQNIDTDFAYLTVELQEHAAKGLQAQSPDSRDLIEGYVAGYNAYLLTRPALPKACAGAPWVREITAQDLMAHILDVSMVGVPRALLTAVGHAAPPVASEEHAFSRVERVIGGRSAAASNGWAIGSERSEEGRGMLLANPHFPWEGDLQLHEVGLRVPGRLDAYGVTLGGVPGILIGYNEHLAWTHTVSTSAQSVVYALTLDADDPVRYLDGGELRSMSERSYTISVLGRRGSLESRSRTLYRSHLGPLVDAPFIGWTSEQAAALKTTALSNYGAVEQYLLQASARSLEEFEDAQTRARGAQWANTVYADDAGHALYFDAARVPLLEPAAGEAYAEYLEQSPIAALYAKNGVVLLNGSDSRFAWRSDGVGPERDVSPFELAPRLERDDFVFNSNEDYWLTQPASPLTARPEDAKRGAGEAYSFLYGQPGTPRSPRTRMNALLLSDTTATGPAGEDGKLTLDELTEAILSDRSLMAELLRPELVERCQRTPEVELGGMMVSLTETCEALAAWNGRYDDAAGPGALLFREFLADFGEAELRDEGSLFARPFDADDPLHTPFGLAPTPAVGADPVLQALARSTQLAKRLSSEDLSLQSLQHTRRGEEVVPVFGCLEQEGCANVVRFSDQFNSSSLPALEQGKVLSAAGLTEDGYWVNHGTSFLMAVEFTSDGPRARALLTYGQSSDPSSPFYRDQLQLFAQRKLRPVRFTEQEIAASPALEEVCVRMRDGAVYVGCD